MVAGKPGFSHELRATSYESLAVGSQLATLNSQLAARSSKLEANRGQFPRRYRSLTTNTSTRGSVQESCNKASKLAPGLLSTSEPRVYTTKRSDKGAISQRYLAWKVRRLMVKSREPEPDIAPTASSSPSRSGTSHRIRSWCSGRYHRWNRYAGEIPDR